MKLNKNQVNALLSKFNFKRGRLLEWDIVDDSGNTILHCELGACTLHFPSGTGWIENNVDVIMWLTDFDFRDDLKRKELLFSDR